LLVWTLIQFTAIPVWAASDKSIDVARRVPVQHDGRIKSMDVFARETLELISGRQTWEKRPAIDLIFRNLSKPKQFQNIPFVRVDHHQLKELLGLSLEQKYFSFIELKEGFPIITDLVRRANDRRDNDERPSLLEQKAELLHTRLVVIQNLATGQMPQVIPPEEAGSGAWQSPYFDMGLLSMEFRHLAQLYSGGKQSEFASRAKPWLNKVYAMTDSSARRAIYFEILYYQIKPFHYAWILYLWHW